MLTNRRSSLPPRLVDPFEYSSQTFLDLFFGRPAQRSVLKLIHGEIKDKPQWAWVEFSGWALDLSLVGRVTLDPVTIADYRIKNEAKPIVVYESAEEVIARIARHGSHGPWFEPEPVPIYLLNGVALSEELSDFFLLNGDYFSDAARKRIEALKPGERLESRDWTIERAL